MRLRILTRSLLSNLTAPLAIASGKGFDITGKQPRPHRVKRKALRVTERTARHWFLCAVFLGAVTIARAASQTRVKDSVSRIQFA